MEKICGFSGGSLFAIPTPNVRPLPKREYLMNIEILTTKKKLSKSIIKQLDPATNFDIGQIVNVGKIGFYVRGIGVGGALRTGLFETNCKWVTLPLLEWIGQDGSKRLTCKNEGGNGCFIKDFESVECRDKWLHLYSQAKALCEKNHLFL